jgi:hypothetical protein
MAKNYELNIDINTNSKETQSEFERLRNSIAKATEQVEDLSKEFGENSKEADAARKSLAGLTLEYDEMSKSATDLGATFEDVYGEVKPLTAQMGEMEDRLYQLSLAGDTSSKEFKDLTAEVGRYRRAQRQTDLQVDAASTTMDEKLGGALQGATSAFAGAQGAMALMGVESGKLEETLLKVQAAMALAEGVKGIREAIPLVKQFGSIAINSLKGVRSALVSTGIGAIIVAVGLLIANWKEFNQWVEKVRNSTDGWGVALKALLLVVAPFVFAINELNKGLQALGITESEEEIAEKKRWEEKKKRLEEEKQLQEEQFNREQKLFDQRIALLEAEGKATFELTQEKIQASIDYQKEIRNELLLEKARILSSIDERTALGKQLAKAQRENLKEIQKQLDESRDAILENENQLKINVLKNNKEKIQSYNDYAEARISAQREIEDLENELLKDGLEKELEINRDAFRRLREDTLKNTELIESERSRLIDLYRESEAKAEKEIRDKYKQEELQRLEDTEALLREVKVNSGVETLNLMQSQFQAEMELRIANDKEQERLEKEAAERRKRNIEFSIESTKQSLEVILSLTELFGKKGEKEARRAFNVQKAAQIASATIDTYRNAVSAYGSQFVPVPDATSPVRGGIAAGIAVAAGLANIAQIASQKFEGGGEGGAVTQPSAAGLERGAITPEFNVVGDSGINQLAQLQQQPVQAFVVSGDVTTAQALDRNRVQNATL